MINKESKTCLCELINLCSEFCHLDFQSRNKGSMDLKFCSSCFFYIVLNLAERESDGTEKFYNIVSFKIF